MYLDAFKFAISRDRDNIRHAIWQKVRGREAPLRLFSDPRTGVAAHPR
jgi:hypothetical protein